MGRASAESTSCGVEPQEQVAIKSQCGTPAATPCGVRARTRSTGRCDIRQADRGGRQPSLKGTGGSTFHVPTRLAPPASRQLRLNATSRDSRILPWLFSLTLLPLLLTIFMSDTDVRSRVEKTLEHHPEIAQHADTVNSEEDLFSILPDHRIEGALLARNSLMHWLFAFVAAGMFLGLIKRLFDLGNVQFWHIAAIGATTATFGVLNLLIFQWMAGLTRGVGGFGGIVGILFLFVKFIAFSYQAALDPRNGFLLSFVGFTCGVGLCEEMTKGIPVLVRISNDRRMNWRGACALGLASGAGFGIAESVLYAGRDYNGVFGGDVYLVRFISCVALHAVWCRRSRDHALSPPRRILELL